MYDTASKRSPRKPRTSSMASKPVGVSFMTALKSTASHNSNAICIMERLSILSNTRQTFGCCKASCNSSSSRAASFNPTAFTAEFSKQPTWNPRRTTPKAPLPRTQSETTRYACSKLYSACRHTMQKTRRSCFRASPFNQFLRQVSPTKPHTEQVARETLFS